MDDQLAAVAALDEPTRRKLYGYVARRREPVSRDEVADTFGLSRGTVAFHLDKLVDEGLLAVGYARRTGRTGPGAGRPAKLYSRSERQVAVSLPPRHYDLAGHLLATAVEAAEETGQPVRSALARHARELGRELGARSVSETDGEPARRDAALSALEEHGFEPRTEAGGVVLGNCPFHALAQRHTELVCGMNLDLLHGLLEGIGDTGLHALLEPAPGHCCVRLAPR